MICVPSHKIHIKIAQDIGQKLDVNIDSFILGAVLPDLTNKIPHYIAHFKTDPNNHTFYNKDMFINKYLTKDKNPFLLGYLTHILTDEYYNKYIKKNYYVFKDGKLCGITKLDGQILYSTPSKVCDIKQKEFTKYDKYLLNNYDFYPFKDYSILDNIPIIEECDYDKKYLKKYIDNYNSEIKYNRKENEKLNFDIISKDILDKLYDDCINYIINYMKDLSM